MLDHSQKNLKYKEKEEVNDSIQLHLLFTWSNLLETNDSTPNLVDLIKLVLDWIERV